MSFGTGITAQVSVRSLEIEVGQVGRVGQVGQVGSSLGCALAHLPYLTYPPSHLRVFVIGVSSAKIAAFRFFDKHDSAGGLSDAEAYCSLSATYRRGYL